MGLQFPLGRLLHSGLDGFQKAAVPVFVQCQRMARRILQPKAVQVGREQRFQFPGGLLLLLSLGAGGALLDDLAILHAHAQGAEIIVTAEHPFVGCIGIFQIVDGAEAVRRKNVVPFCQCTDRSQFCGVFRAVAAGTGQCRQSAACTGAIGDDVLGITGQLCLVVPQPADARFQVHHKRRSFAHAASGFRFGCGCLGAFKEFRVPVAGGTAPHANTGHNIAMRQRTEGRVRVPEAIRPRAVRRTGQITTHRVRQKNGGRVQGIAVVVCTCVIILRHIEVQFLDGVGGCGTVFQSFISPVLHRYAFQRTALHDISIRIKTQSLSHENFLSSYHYSVFSRSAAHHFASCAAA